MKALGAEHDSERMLYRMPAWSVMPFTLCCPLIGIAEVLTIAYGGSQARDLVVYGLMILILLLRPQGLLGGARTDVGQRV